MWKWFSTVAEELVSSDSQNITTGYQATNDIGSILSDDMAVNDWWSLPSTFFEQMFKQLEVIQKVILS